MQQRRHRSAPGGHRRQRRSRRPGRQQPRQNVTGRAALQEADHEPGDDSAGDHQLGQGAQRQCLAAPALGAQTHPQAQPAQHQRAGAGQHGQTGEAGQEHGGIGAEHPAQHPHAAPLGSAHHCAADHVQRRQLPAQGAAQPAHGEADVHGDAREAGHHDEGEQQQIQAAHAGHVTGFVFLRTVAQHVQHAEKDLKAHQKQEQLRQRIAVEFKQFHGAPPRP